MSANIPNDESAASMEASGDTGRLMPAPYLLFLGDAKDEEHAKTAFGLAQWRRSLCVGQIRLPGCAVDTGLPDLTIKEAAARGARSFVLGAVNAGGVISDVWLSYIREALDCGLDVVSGMHQRLSDIPSLVELAREKKRTLVDVRGVKRRFETATGRKRTGKRILTVGTDCAVGKKYSALALEQALRARGVNAEFRATGQTGIMIAGRGVAIDAVVADFMAGAAEWLSPDNDPDHWDVIEGQGSLFHPAYAGVSLGLLHGSQPDALVVCHQLGRKHVLSVENYKTPELDEFIELTLACARLTNPNVVIAGICVNTSTAQLDDAASFTAAMEREHGVPCCDPIRDGAGKIADHILSCFGAPQAKGQQEI